MSHIVLSFMLFYILNPDSKFGIQNPDSESEFRIQIQNPEFGFRFRRTKSAKPHSNVESLKRALKKAWNEITLDTLIKIVDNFPKRLKACVDAKGGHFE
uniref:Uncharacterized protein n=1 Tax=Acrobeloides nanus TaxID=290746 RepID=A0A914C2W1_9BILA